MQSRADLFAIADALPPPRSLPTGGLPAPVTSARIGPESDLQPWQKELTQDCERRDWESIEAHLHRLRAAFPRPQVVAHQSTEITGIKSHRVRLQ